MTAPTPESAMSNDKLLPCPFCGGAPKLTEVEPAGYVVECTNGICNASTNIHYSCGDDARPLVAEQWNRRTPAQEVGRDGWRPIESAPKGEMISIWIAGTNAAGQKWSDGDGEAWLYCYYDQICGEWRTTRPSGHLRCVPERFVTHWQPLLAPTAIAAEQAERQEGDRHD